MHFDLLILLAAVLVLSSIFLAKFLENIGIPTLLLFIGVGILAGSDGPGGIHFENYNLSQNIGIVSLIFILFAGGLETNWQSSKKIFWPSFVLSTFGVMVTAVTLGIFVHLFLGEGILWSLLIGAIVSSTDASAVFSILRMNKISLKGQLAPLLELESGSNDPMAVFLTLALIQLILNNLSSGGISEGNISVIFTLVAMFLMQMSIGAIAGLLLGKLMVFINNNLKFSYEGIYPVFVLAFCFFIYSFTVFIQGSGFLAIYIAGIVAGNSHFIFKRGMIRFFDGLAMFSQIIMFVTLGMLVYPTNLISIFGGGLVIAFALIFLARPISVFLSLIPFKFTWKEKTFISWVGLRGSVPIILAIFPLLAGVPQSMQIFNIVFFIVIVSVLLQGWTISSAAKLFGLSVPHQNKKSSPLEFMPAADTNMELLEMIIPYNCEAHGKQIVDLNFPPGNRIVLIYRNDTSIIPEGTSLLESGDVLMILVNKESIADIKKIFTPA